MTPFSFVHDLRAASVAEVFAVYVLPAHLAEQDRRAGVVLREFTELVLDDAGYRRACRVTAARQLPAFVRPFISGPLVSDETAVWDRRTSFVEIRVRPAILKGKAQLQARYQLDLVAPGLVRRTYAGSATVEIPLLGGKIERTIVDDLGRTLDGSAACTQEWIDRGAASS